MNWKVGVLVTQSSSRQSIHTHGRYVDMYTIVYSPNVNMAQTFSQITMFVIASCGFGITLPWSEPKQTSAGKMSKSEFITYASTHVIQRFITPKWMYSALPFQRSAE